MKPKLLLRIAAIIMLLHGIGHTMGVATWQKPGGEIPQQVVQLMQTEQFSFMGKDGSTMAGSIPASAIAERFSCFLSPYCCGSFRERRIKL